MGGRRGGGKGRGVQGRKSSPQKSRPLESGHRRHAVWIAIEYSYISWAKKVNLNLVRTRLVFAETVTFVSVIRTMDINMQNWYDIIH